MLVGVVGVVVSFIPALELIVYSFAPSTLPPICIGHQRPWSCFHQRSLAFFIEYVHSGSCKRTAVGAADAVDTTVRAVGTDEQQYAYRYFTPVGTACAYRGMGGVSNFFGGASDPGFS